MNNILTVYNAINRYFSSVPHVAGTKYDLQQAEWVRDQFVAAGLDEVKLVPYDVLLSYPKPGVLNTVSLVDSKGSPTFTTLGRQQALGGAESPEENSEDILSNFNAYSARGVVEVK